MRYIIFLNTILNVISFSEKYFNSWNCIGIIEKINFKKPYKINIGELPLVVWKNPKNNKLITSINICKHLGSILDNGIITKMGNLQCQYHGLEYTEKDNFGETIEHEGKLFWALNPENKMPYNTPYINNKKFKKSFLEIDMNCDFKDSVYNTMDLLHPEFVHNKIVGFGSKTPPTNIKNYKIGNDRLALSFDYFSNKMTTKINNNSKMTENFHLFYYPSFSWSRVTFDKTKHIIIGVNFLPLETKKTRWYITLCHNYYLSPLQQKAVQIMALTILSQDFLQMNNQYKNNNLKNEIIFDHNFNNEKILLEMKEMLKDYEYPDINIITNLYKYYKNK
jgi:phenylpropionate dioxygenase-like ring-hydroxylating dioxygenase large terminal subunit